MMRIGSQSDYNIAARALRIQPYRLGEVRKAQDSKAANGLGTDAQKPVAQYIPENGGGVIQTRVSPENAFQKAKLENPRSGIEAMAEKLMDKLPDILRDMKNVPEYSEAAQNVGTGKVVVSDRNAAVVAQQNAQKAAEPLANFSL